MVDAARFGDLEQCRVGRADRDDGDADVKGGITKRRIRSVHPLS